LQKCFPILSHGEHALDIFENSLNPLPKYGAISIEGPSPIFEQQRAIRTPKLTQAEADSSLKTDFGIRLRADLVSRLIETHIAVAGLHKGAISKSSVSC
jgi:hypothetical protein